MDSIIVLKSKDFKIIRKWELGDGNISAGDASGDAKYDDGADLNSDDWVNVIDGALVGLNRGRKA